MLFFGSAVCSSVKLSCQQYFRELDFHTCICINQSRNQELFGKRILFDLDGIRSQCKCKLIALQSRIPTNIRFINRLLFSLTQFEIESQLYKEPPLADQMSDSSLILLSDATTINVKDARKLR